MSVVIARAITAVVCCAGILAAAVTGPAAQAATAVFDLSVDYQSGSSVTPGAKVNLTTQMPVAQAGTVTQEIVQTIDPTKLRLTGAWDVTYPAGWTLSVSFDGTTFTSTLPTTATGSATSWDKVTAVKAAGPIVSQGESNGYQVAEGEASGAPTTATPPSLPLVTTGDPYYSFFDAKRTMVFYIAHKKSGNILGCVVIATNQKCNGAPYSLNGVGSENYALGKVINNRVWFPGASTYGGLGGLACLDITSLIADPTSGTPVDCGVYPEFQSVVADLVGGRASQSEQQIWGFEWNTAKFICFDTATRASCGSISTAVPKATGVGDYNFHRWGDRLYANTRHMQGANVVWGDLYCYRISTGAPCANFPQPKGSDRHLFTLPDASGQGVAVCGGWDCYDAAGNRYTPPASIGTVLTGYRSVVNTIGTRILASNRGWSTSGIVWCWDAALNGGAGGWCYGTASYSALNYTVTQDPLLPECIWITTDQSPNVRTRDISTNQWGCGNTTKKVLTLSGTTAVPRMACGTLGTSGIRAWRTLDLATPASTAYTSVTLSVASTTGAAIVGWQNKSVTTWPLDISALDPAVTGSAPQFQLTFTDLDASVTSASVKISAVGDAPQLCLRPEAVLVCPAAGAGLGFLEGMPTATTTPVITSGVARDAASNASSLGPDSDVVNVSEPEPDACGGQIRGSTSLSGGGVVAGVTVNLLTYSGSPALSNGVPITTTTDANGNYSFGNLTPGSYKVSFGSNNGTSANGTQYPDTGAGAAGTATSNATSTTLAVVATQTDVVNATYPAPLLPGDDTSLGTQGVAQTKDLTTNDIPSTGRTLTKSSVYLCDVGHLDADCKTAAARTKTVAGVGTYTVNSSTGVMTFTPEAGYTGTPTPLTYVISDSGGSTASATYTPTVVGTPVVADDTSTGAWNTAQLISPLANDLPGTSGGTAYPLLPSTMGICLNSVTAASSCTGKTSITIANQGTYSLNTTTGEVTFTPVSTFTGTATPIKYAVADATGTRVIASITPTVTAPPAPTAAPESKLVQPGGTVAFTTLTGSGGLGVSGGPALTTASTFLCGISPAETQPNCTKTSVSVPNEGTYTLNQSTGVVTYSASANATTGAKTLITYVVKDGLNRTASATLTPVVPGPPAAVDDTSSGGWDAVQVISVLANDVPSPGTSLTVSSVRLCETSTADASCDDTVLTIANQGTYTVDPATGAVSFDPLPTFSGMATPIKYVATQSDGLTDSGMITPTVAAPGVPVASDDTRLVTAGSPAVFPPLIGSGALTTSGGPALASACLIDPVTSTCDADGVVVVTGGTYSLVNGVVTFTLAAGFSGTPDPITYQVTDAIGHVDTGVLTPRVPALPVAADDTSLGEQGAVQVIAPLGNDTAGDAAAPIVPTSVRICSGAGPCSGTGSVSVAGGVYSVAPSTGLVTFTPDAAFVGTAPPLTYTVTDALGRSTTATITAVVQPKPTPIAVNDSQSGPFGQSIAFIPLTNDSAGTDPGGNLVTSLQLDSSTLFLCGPTEMPAGCARTSVTTADGTYALSGGTVTFTGNATFTGVATQPLQYQVSNSYQLSGNIGTPYTASAYLIPTITVAPVVVVPDTASTAWNTPVTKDVLADDTSGAPISTGSLKLCGPADAGTCAQTSVTVPDQGTYDVVGGQVRFTPLPGFSGAATPITYGTTDALGRPVSSTFTPTVAAPTPPIAGDEAKSLLAGGAVSFTTITEAGPLVAPGTPGPGSVVDGAACLLVPGTSTCDDGGVVVTADGTYVLNPLTGVVSYTADQDAPAGPQVAVSYRVVDSIGQTATATLTPTVYARPWVPAKTLTDVVNVAQTFDALSGATFQSGYSPTAASVRLCSADDTVPDCTETTLTVAGEGTYTVDVATGVITFTPDTGYTGTAQSVPFSVTDGLGQKASNTITPIVAPLPTPTATDDERTGVQGSVLTFTPDANDSPGSAASVSVSGLALNPLTIRLCGVSPVQTLPNCTQTTVTTSDGTYVVDLATGEVTFTGAAGFTGRATTPVAYQISSTFLVSGIPYTETASALLIPTITAATPPGGGGGGGGGTPSPSPSPTPSPSPGPDPVTEPDRGVGRPGEPVRLEPIGNDTPGQGQEFDEGSLRLCPVGSTPPDCSGLVVDTPQGAWVVDPFTGAVQFTPEDGFTGKVEMPYVIQTEDGQMVDSVITIWITGPPAASDDASTGKVDTPQRLSPIANDAADAAPWAPSSLRLCGDRQSPPTCDATRVETVDGTYQVDPATGQVVFTPVPGFTGEATPVRYQLTDEAGQVADAWLRPSVRGSGGEGSGWLSVRKVITQGADLRTGAVKLVTTCTGPDGQRMKRTHVMDTGIARDSWRVQVPAGMTCKVHEKAHGAPETSGVSPTWDERRWQVDHTPSIEVGDKVPVGTAVPIDQVILSARGGCQVIAGQLIGGRVGTCTVTWRVPDGSVTTRTKWTHTSARAARTGEGTLTHTIPITTGVTTRVTFTNAYTARAHVVTRTVYVTDPCAPVTKGRPAIRGGPPGTCT